jgi:predicted nucleic acid-binding protein
VRFALDSNVLVYALDSTDADKHRIASEIMEQAPLIDAVLIAQCVAEFLNVIRRKHPRSYSIAIEIARGWIRTMPVFPTQAADVLAGGEFSNRHKLQLFDSIIWQVVRVANATIFLSEDYQDGFAADGVTVINPFEPGNRPAIERLLAVVDEQ